MHLEPIGLLSEILLPSVHKGLNLSKYMEVYLVLKMEKSPSMALLFTQFILIRTEIDELFDEGN